MNKQYFGGTGVTDKAVVLPANNWLSLINENFNSPHVMPLNRKDFGELLKINADAAKAVKLSAPYLMSCVCKDGGKKKEDAVSVNLLALDFDCDAKTSTEDLAKAIEYITDPSKLMAALLPWNFIAYTTMRHTPSLPRFRVLIDVAELDLFFYGSALEVIGKRLGLAFDKASLSIVLPMRMPVMFMGDTDDDHPVIASRTDGVGFGKDDLTSFVPPVPITATDLDVIVPVVPPVPNINQDNALDALRLLDADTVVLDGKTNYQTWIEIGMAIKHQFGNEGFALWDGWSSGGSLKKYPNTASMQAKWNSFTTPKGAPVTFATVIKLAQAKGWEYEKIAIKNAIELKAWILDTKRTETELKVEAVKRIVSIPVQSDMEDKQMARLLCKVLNDRFDACALPSEYADLFASLRANSKKSTLNDSAKTAEDEVIPKWARGWFYVAGTGVNIINKFYQPHTGRRYNKETLDASYGMFLTQSNNAQPTAGARPIIQASTYLLHTVKIPKLDDFLYHPQKPDDIIVEVEGKRYANTYRKTYPIADPVLEAEALRHIKTIIARNTGVEWERQELIDWMAFQVQYPGIKINWAPVFLGMEGTGKSSMFEMMKAALGKSNAYMTNGSLLVESGFTGFTEGNQLVCIEEIRVSGSNKHDIMDKLKTPITGVDVEVHNKGLKPYNIVNVTNYMFCSNYPDALPVTATDRRYLVVDSRIFDIKDVIAAKEYFNELYKFIEASPGAFRSALLNHKISAEFAPKLVKHTAAFYAMQDTSKTALELCVEELLTTSTNALITGKMVVVEEVLRIVKERSVLCYGAKEITAILRRSGFVCNKVGTNLRYLIDGKTYQVWVNRKDAFNEKGEFTGLPQETVRSIITNAAKSKTHEWSKA